MDDILGAIAFGLLIGGQFLAAIVVSSKRDTIYANPNERVPQPAQPTGEYPEAAQAQHRTVPEIALARLAHDAIAYKSGGSDEIAASICAANHASAALRFNQDTESHSDVARLNTPPPEFRADADRPRR
jgi:hypothetical protein